MGRTMTFLAESPSGDVTVGLVHAADAAGSQAEAERALALFEGGAETGGLVLRARLVDINELDAAPDLQALYVPAGMAAHYPAIQAKALLSFTTDTACVDDGACVVWVKSDPNVEIRVNLSAANQASVEFKPAFRLMIQEI